MSYFILIYICIFGLCLGSFYNVVILRSLSGESIVFPPSKCPKCNQKLLFWHNIPILSYILLRGKCYYCKQKISFQYPLIEFITMCLFAFTYLKFGLTFKSLFYIIILSLLLIMTVTDIKEKVADCTLAIAMAVCGIIFNFVFTGSVLQSILGMIVAVLILEGIARLGILFIKTRAMGEADTYVAGALGACFGLNPILMILLYSLAASMLFILPVFCYKQYKNNNKLLCVLLALFITATIIFQTMIQNYITFSFLIMVSILLIINILKNIKSNINISYLPFVPAFMLGTLWFIFFA